MRRRLEDLAYQTDEELFQPLILLWGLATTKTMGDSIKKFVELRRKYGMYVDMSVLTPHIVDSADNVVLLDHEGLKIGDINDTNDLAMLVGSNQDRINLNQLGHLRAEFPDDSVLEIPIPLHYFDSDDPASVKY